MNGKQRLNGFNFNYDTALDEQVHPQTVVKCLSVEFEDDALLPRNRQSPFLKSPSE